MTLSSDLGIGTVWDNYDRFVETQSGKDTLHDTVGMMYQIVNENSESALPHVYHDTSESSVEVILASPVITHDSSTSSHVSELLVETAATTKRRRTYLQSVLDIQPCRKETKIDVVKVTSDFDQLYIRSSTLG